MALPVQFLPAGAEGYTGWMTRPADNAYFITELVDLAGSPTLDIDIYHKNTEDSGDGALAASFTSVTAVGRSHKLCEGLKEQVRLKIAVTGSSGDWVLYRMLTPVWFDSARG